MVQEAISRMDSSVMIALVGCVSIVLSLVGYWPIKIPFVPRLVMLLSGDLMIAYSIWRHSISIPKTNSAKEKAKKPRNIGYVCMVIIFFALLSYILFDEGILFNGGKQIESPTSTVTDEEIGVVEDDIFPYENIEEMPVCDFTDIKHHCLYYVVENVNDYKVAVMTYSEKRYQGKIKEFYRDEKGGIPSWIVGENNFTLVPPLEMNLDLYTKYFGLLNISKCDENATEKPCWQELKVTSYETLARNYYDSPDYIDCIKYANKIEYDASIDGLQPMELEVGKVIVLPVCD